ncbi:hypothetical protein BKI52_04320 [marine bacterium AO1-C]|nr:hypothetical protein BKI52_04320 [marine bacterium AO1-C]
MKKITIYLSLILLVLASACSTSSKVTVPVSRALPTTQDNYTIAWLGNSEAYRYIDGKYQRDASYDYTFSVIQRRYGNTWKSIKDLHRIHPDYDGKAGERDQTMFFGIDFQQSSQGITSAIQSSLGKGSGKSDKEFREQSFVLKFENISSFAPYNTMRITQHYQYEKGILLETVELYKVKNEKEVPFMKMEEKAEIFRPARLGEAPTVFK